MATATASRADPTTVFSLNPGALTHARLEYQSELISQVVKDLFPNRKVEELSVADIGAGTGALGDKFLSLGCTDLHFVEPDEKLCGILALDHANSNNKISIHNAKGEKTGLPDASVDLIVMGDASHWISNEATKEFTRILKPGGKVANFYRYWSTESPITRELHRLLLAEQVPEYITSSNQFIRSFSNISRRTGRHLVSEEDSRLTEYSSIHCFSKEQLLEYFQSISSTARMATEESDAFIDKILNPLWEFARKEGYLDAKDNLKVAYTTGVFFGSPRITRIKHLGIETGTNLEAPQAII